MILAKEEINLSMHPNDCPGWDYEDHQDHESILPTKSTQLLINLRSGSIDTLQICCDTRNAHDFLFSELVPSDYPYFAGNYRGQEYRCLKYYEVEIRSDPTVGVYATGVHQAMSYVKNTLNKTLPAIDSAQTLPETQLPKVLKIVYLVKFATRVLVEFLRVHPYANGNGHMSRFVVFSLLARYDLWPKNWPLDESPNYHQHIFDYRRGNMQPLEDFILKSILGK